MDVSNTVLFEKHSDHIAIVTLNRPEARNAVNSEVANRLGEIVEEIENDPNIRVAILTATGEKVFCAGADLKQVSKGGLDNLYTDAGGFAGFVQYDRKKIWIAAVNGMALAGGFEIVLACDLVVAADTTMFGLPEVTVGLLAAAGGVFRLPRVFPRALAFELIATGNRLNAQSALDHGLINRSVSVDQLIDEALKLAGKIASNAPLAVQESLKIARLSGDLDNKALNQMSMESQDLLSQTEDFKEGPRAFIEKRAPKWVGR
jgi:enoyl-CoA hydratase/carnithine racemase